jgi:regulator of sigma E protease
MIVVLQIVLGLVILGILVLVHELGHFSAAKAFSIRVLAFSVGFGRPLVKKTFGGTEYRLSAIPFGGYVHMSGEHPEEKPDVEPGDFTSKPIWQRAIVAIAGPLANFLFAMACLYLVFLLGVDTPVYLLRPVVGSVDDNSKAAQAGFLAGDSIVSVDGKTVASWEDLERTLSLQLPRYDIVVRRGAAAATLTIGFAKVKSSRIIRDVTGGLHPCLPAVIGSVSSGFPGKLAGLQEKDTVVSISGRVLHSWYELSSIVSRYDTLSGPLVFDLRRNGAAVSAPVMPKYNKDEKRFMVGISPAQPEMRKVRFGPVASVGKMLEKSWSYTTMIFDVLDKLISKQVSPKMLAGPVGIVQMSGVMALSGLTRILDFMAVIGINLAVLNLLPLIITDGGMLLFLCIEGIRRKPLAVRSQVFINRIAISFFILLALYVTFNDITRIPDLIRMFGK